MLFRYTPTGEGASGPWAFLRTGYLQADASNVFDRLFTGQAASAVELGCWSHARHLVALEDTDCRVAYPLTLVARLYRIEHLADARDLTPEGRRDLRQHRAAPVLQTLQRWCVATQQTEPPSTDLARAAGYALNHWTSSRILKASVRTLPRAAPPNDVHQRALEFARTRQSAAVPSPTRSNPFACSRRARAKPDRCPADRGAPHW